MKYNTRQHRRFAPGALRACATVAAAAFVMAQAPATGSNDPQMDKLVARYSQLVSEGRQQEAAQTLRQIDSLLQSDPDPARKGADASAKPPPPQSASVTPPAPQAEAPPPERPAPPPAAPPPAPPAEPQAASPAPAKADLAYLPFVVKGTAFVNNGDIASARNLFRYAAEHGHLPQAMVEMGRTYDPRSLSDMRVVGIPPDVAEARRWYRMAADAGDPEGRRLLNLLPAR